MSSMVPCAPSNRMRLPAARASSSRSHTPRRRAGSWARARQVGSSSALASTTGLPKPAAQRIVMREQRSTLAASDVGLAEVADPDGAAADLVLVGRADAAPRRADLAVAGARPRASRRGRGAAAGSARRAWRCSGCRGVTDTPCAGSFSTSSRSAQGSTTTPLPMIDELALAHHARRQQRQLVGLVADDQRMAGIVAALEAHHDSARSVSQSTILPLPSSPHWAPITATLAISAP